MNPLSGLYDFVRAHLLIVNNVILASGTLVGALDFLGPRLSILPKLVYTCTALLVLLMLVAALAPGIVGRSIQLLGHSVQRSDSTPLWKRGGWQFALAIFLGVTVIGFASVAKASQGGLIAGSAPELRQLQTSMLSLQTDVTQIREGVATANVKLDRVIDAVDPANPADRCPDIPCAIHSNASPGAIRKLLDKGAVLPRDGPNQGVLLAAMADGSKPGRTQVLDMLLAHGLRADGAVYSRALDSDPLTPQAVRIAHEVIATARMDDEQMRRITFASSGDVDRDAWNVAMACMVAGSHGAQLIEVAAIRGDLELYRHLVDHGVKLPERPLICRAYKHAGGYTGALLKIADGRVAVAPMP